MSNPFGDIGSVVVAELGGAAAVTLRRFAAPTYVNGMAVATAPTVSSLDAAVQPSTRREVMKLPEGERTKEAISIFTVEVLQESDVSTGAKSDQVVWKGRTYEVQIVEDWTIQAAYALAIATRIGV